jgi:NAD(P)-dependent dehydrogenase (short-subunit alcohol dehydrogenase family)
VANASEIADVIDATGQVVVVTGADGHLGSETSFALARAHATVVLSCRNATKCAATAQDVQARYPGTKVDVVIIDFSAFSNVKQGAEYLLKKYKQIDALVNNEGCVDCGPFTEDGYVGSMEVNLFAPALFAQLLLPILKRVIFVGSASGYGPVLDAKNNPVFYSSVKDLMSWSRNESALDIDNFYGLAKFGLVQYTTGLAKQKPDLVAFTVSPGFSRDPPSSEPCPSDNILFSPCPQWPSQGATGIVFAAIMPGIEEVSGANFDYLTTIVPGFQYPFWTQNDPSCVPRALPGWLGKTSGPIFWTDADRATWVSLVQATWN